MPDTGIIEKTDLKLPARKRQETDRSETNEKEDAVPFSVGNIDTPDPLIQSAAIEIENTEPNPPTAHTAPTAVLDMAASASSSAIPAFLNKLYTYVLSL